MTVAIFKNPVHKGGKRPPLGRLNDYLAKEEKRETVLFLDGHGKAIDPDLATKEAGGYAAEHWHAIVAPSHLECSSLTQRFGTPEKAAIEHGKAMAAEIRREIGSEKVPNIAIHFEHDKLGNLRWHYHFVGEEKANGRLFGEGGKLQKAWDRVAMPDKKPIVNWRENRLYIAAKRDLKDVQIEQRKLSKNRQAALKAIQLPWEKTAIRDRFACKEVALINQRHALETKAANHRYGSRNDSGSLAHRTELSRIDARKATATTRIANRGQDPKAIGRIKSATGRGISSAKRGATKGIALVANAASKLNEDLKRATEKGRVRDPHHLKVEIPGAHQMKSAALSIVGGALRTAAEAVQATAKAAAKITFHTGKASVKVAIGLVTALPTGGSSLAKASADASKDLAEGATESGKELGTGIKNTSIEAARIGADVGKAMGNVGIGALPRPAQEAIRAGSAATRTAAATFKDVVTLDLTGAASTALIGAGRTLKHAAGATIEGAKTLPPALNLPLKAIEMVPLIGQVVKVAHTAMEMAATVAPKAFELDL